MTKEDLTVCELFAGVGGFHLGLSRSGWKVVWANQWEPGKKQQWAFECYKRHFEVSGTRCVNEDIGKVETKDTPSVTLLVGGFPCQDYSVATTKAHGIEGKKGVLWWHIERILRENIDRGTPIPFVLLENVDRLIRSPTAQRGRDFGIILSCLNNLGYAAEWRVINASDYAYPQKRRRTFIFATLAKKAVDILYNNKADADNIRLMPDFVVQKGEKVYFIEVKFRSNEEFRLADLPSNYPYENTYFIVVSKKHIKCISYWELKAGMEIAPSSKNYLGSRKEFELDRQTIIDFCDFAVTFFENA